MKKAFNDKKYHRHVLTGKYWNQISNECIKYLVTCYKCLFSKDCCKLNNNINKSITVKYLGRKNI